jgi:cystathionine beta-lyase
VKNQKKHQQFDFNTVVDRRGTSSEKWRMYEQAGILPLWLADMDFLSPPAVMEALHRRVDHGVFGYTVVPKELVEVVIAVLESQYHWKVEAEWLVWLPSLVTGLNLACRAVGTDGDEVLTAVPVYPPFLTAPRNSRRNLVTVPLICESDRWSFDFEGLEDAITPRTKLLLLCSPHNPVGRVFTYEELAELAEICSRNQVVICSDEIHCELVLDEDKRHIPTAVLSHEIAKRTITLMSPSKTFNLPGLGCAFAIIPNKELRRAFRRARRGIVPPVNVLAFEAALAAYRDCSDWHGQLINYLRYNHDIVTHAIDQMPGLSMTHVEGTYLAWIDTQKAGITEPAKFFAESGIGLADGVTFGGSGFVRLTFGCPKSLLEDGLKLMERALSNPELRKT